ncbi:hypothetical protein KAZ93_01690 [Patescibacteria group bacterium]|nr:hypothetical protein [Patescibacteria group bacterium]
MMLVDKDRDIECHGNDIDPTWDDKEMDDEWSEAHQTDKVSFIVRNLPLRNRCDDGDETSYDEAENKVP